jgi:hypothetical protein
MTQPVFFSGTPWVAPVPEPSTMTLGGCGALLLAFGLARRQAVAS